MSKKKIQEIPSQIISKQTHRINLRKTLLSTKFNWLAKYLTKQNQQNTEEKGYLMTSIKMHPQRRHYARRSHLQENRQIANKSIEATSSTKYESKMSLDHKPSLLRTRIYTQQIQNISKAKKGRNTSLLLNTNQPKQTFNFIETDIRRFGQHVKSDLEVYNKKRYRKEKMDLGCSRLTPWNLDEDKQNIFSMQM